MFSLNPQSTTPLVLQVVDGFRLMVEDGSLRAGAKVPSIRQFAHAHGVSVYTVVDAYDRLVAQGIKLGPMFFWTLHDLAQYQTANTIEGWEGIYDLQGSPKASVQVIQARAAQHE